MILDAEQACFFRRISASSPLVKRYPSFKVNVPLLHCQVISYYITLSEKVTSWKMQRETKHKKKQLYEKNGAKKILSCFIGNI